MNGSSLLLIASTDEVAATPTFHHASLYAGGWGLGGKPHANSNILEDKPQLNEHL